MFSGICNYDVITVAYEFTPTTTGITQVIACADEIFCQSSSTEVLAEVNIPPVPVGIAIVNPPLERGQWEEISFFSGDGADSLYFSSSLGFSDVPQGCTSYNVYSLSCLPGDYRINLLIKQNEVATTVTFFARSWYGSEERHTSITAGITDHPVADTANFRVQGGYVVEPGDLITMTSVITSGRYYDRLPITTTVGEANSGLDIVNYSIITPNGGGCSLALDYSTVTCGAVQVEASQVVTLEVYARVLDVKDGRLFGEMQAGTESYLFDLIYNKYSLEITGEIIVGGRVQIQVGTPNVGYYSMHLKGLKALELPTGCLPDPGANEPGHWNCETLGFGRSLLFQSEVTESRGWVRITSPYGWAYEEFETLQDDSCQDGNAQGALQYVTGYVLEGMLPIGELVVRALNTSGEEIGCAVTTTEGKVTWMGLKAGPEGEVITFATKDAEVFTCGSILRPPMPAQRFNPSLLFLKYLLPKLLLLCLYVKISTVLFLILSISMSKLRLIILILIALFCVGFFVYRTSFKNTPIPPGELLSKPVSEKEQIDCTGDYAVSITCMHKFNYQNSNITIESTYQENAIYTSYIASYLSNGLKIYGLLTVPNGDLEETYPAVVFLHGYIPPSTYKTTEKYEAYVNYLASNGFVVFKIDYRGHGESQGEPGGGYFGTDYIVDAINAKNALKDFKEVNNNKISVWGHSMSGNVVLRSILVDSGFYKAVVWAGAVFTYEDMVKYGINDLSYQRNPNTNINRPNNVIRESLRSQDFKLEDSNFWLQTSPKFFINELTVPIQIHHAVDDKVVNVEYSRGLKLLLEQYGKEFEYYEYPSGGHNITDPSFSLAMKKTAEFLK